MFVTNTACVRSFTNGTTGMSMPSEVSPLAVIVPVFTNGYQWFLPLAANLADNLERRQNYQRAKWRHFQDDNQWKWQADRCRN